MLKALISAHVPAQVSAGGWRAGRRAVQVRADVALAPNHYLSAPVGERDGWRVTLQRVNASGRLCGYPLSLYSRYPPDSYILAQYLAQEFPTCDHLIISGALARRTGLTPAYADGARYSARWVDVWAQFSASPAPEVSISL